MGELKYLCDEDHGIALRDRGVFCFPIAGSEPPVYQLFARPREHDLAGN